MGFFSVEILDPYLCRNEAGQTVHVYEERYRSIISKFLWPKLAEGYVPQQKMQQLNKSEKNLGTLLNSVEWPPRSCDLTPLDYFL